MKHLVVVPSMKLGKTDIQCLRCGSSHSKKKVGLPKEKIKFFYCPTCIQMGRVRSDQPFYYLEEPEPIACREINYFWKGTLTDYQKKASADLVTHALAKQDFLIWAVTGAGKTEMIFEMLNQALSKDWRVCLTSPRVDVCLELFPRIKEVFPKENMALLHGDGKEPYHYSKLVICTTHQLFRFYRAFDVVVLDEVDAFPFSGNVELNYAVRHARKEESALVLLTATPDKHLLSQIKKGHLSYVKIPKRYHGYPLPLPKTIWLSRLPQKISQGSLPPKFHTLLKKQLRSKHRLLIFCPTVELVINLQSVLSKEYKGYSICGVYAEDSERKKKVENMRKEHYDVLISTTILERGVTFKGIDVFVISASHQVFNTASLVQIAGRVGRNYQFPSGKVYFFHEGKSRAMKLAIKQIKTMNRAD
ncbi:hypothetical protein CBF30_01325 [Vagococcus entomophilus]|uniref:DNA/RNA helicase n=2 Tax=Vagococcus entomophilus TaxID=1160095 RepID=A0A430AIG4_9ENTE|nr:hypothetical protein CBF30_01325 [Vagococcus entomophilus]